MKKNTVLYIIITILLVIVAVGVTYIIMDNKNEEEVIEPSNNEEDSNKEEQNEEQITLSESKLQEYLSYVTKNNLLSEFNTYETPSHINDLDDNVIISNALRVLTNNIDFDNMEDSYTIEDFPNYSFDIRYSLEELMELTLKMYNYKINDLNNVTSSNIGEGMYGSTQFIFDYYNGYFYGMNACANCSDNHVGKIKEYNATDEELIIYEYGAYLESEMGENHNTRLVDYQTSKSEILNESCSSTEYDYSCYDELLDEFTLYKHTFKKNNTGYYWYSTEIAIEG